MSGAALTAHCTVQRDGLLITARLHAAAGEIVALVGPSGAGKSSLLAAIAGAERLTDGQISIGGRVVSTSRLHVPSRRRGVVLLDQEARLFPHMTAAENVAFGLRARGVAKPEAGQRALGWLHRVGLGQLGDRSPERLSGGQQQRVALARALAADPALLLLDEPFTALDVETAAGIRDVLQTQLEATAATAVVVTHSADDAAALAARIVVLEAGAVTQEGPVREVLERPSTRFAAAFADRNRVEGFVHDGIWTARGPARLDAAAHGIDDGATAAVFSPSDVRIVRTDAAAAAAPHAATWHSTVLGVRQLPVGVRITTLAHEEDDGTVAVDVTDDSAAALALCRGDAVQLSVPTERMRFVPAEELGAPSRAALA